MALDDKHLANATVMDNLTPVSTVTMPEKAALSNTTTACDPAFDRTPRTSKDTNKSGNPFETDLEAQETDCTPQRSSRMNPYRQSECQVWPDRADWKKHHKKAKMQRTRGCTCMARMSRRNRIITKLLIVLLIVGIAIGVGFGVSKPLGAPIWGSNN